MRTGKALVLAGSLSLGAAGVGYGLTPGEKATDDPILDDEAKVCRVPGRNLDQSSENPEMQGASKEVERILLQAGIDPVLIEEARNNPDKPIPPDWWIIIMRFLTLGVGLSIDVFILITLMKKLKTPGEKLTWGLGVPAMHWVLPELTGHGAAAVLTGWPLSFTAAAFFVALLYKMHNEANEDNGTAGHVAESKSAFTVLLATIAALLGPLALPGSVSVDAAAAGPEIARQAALLGTTPEVANGIQAFGGVLACTALAIGLQQYKDRLLEIFDKDKAENVGKALATGAFSLFLFDCLIDGLKKMFGADIPPDVQNAAVAGLSAITPVISYQISTRGEANSQIADTEAADDQCTGTEG